MCDSCGRPDCNADELTDMLSQMEMPEILLSKAVDPTTLVDLDQNEYEAKIAVGVISSTMGQLLPQVFSGPQEAADALGAATPLDLIALLKNPDMTMAELSAVLRKCGRELAGLIVAPYDSERKRGQKMLKNKAQESMFDGVFKPTTRN